MLNYIVRDSLIPSRLWANRGIGSPGQSVYFSDLRVTGVWSGIKNRWTLPPFTIPGIATVRVTQPAATFLASVATDNGSGFVQITSVGVHGLTAGNAVGAFIYVSAGTGWTPGYYSITAVPNTLSFDLNLAFAAQDSPTISLVGSVISIAGITIPGGIIGPKGSIETIMYLRNINYVSIQQITGATSFRLQNGSSLHSKFSFLIQNTTETTHVKPLNNILSSYSYGIGSSSGDFSPTTLDTTVDFTMPYSFLSVGVNDWSFEVKSSQSIIYPSY